MKQEWQKGKPKESGWYWVLNREAHTGVPASVDVFFFMKNSSDWLEGIDRWRAEEDDMWIGPLEEPELPDE